MVAGARSLVLFLSISITLPAPLKAHEMEDLLKVNYASQKRCSDNINELRSVMIVMLRKIPIMPPVAQIYTPIKSLFNESIIHQSAKNYIKCIEKAELAIKFARPYAR